MKTAISISDDIFKEVEIFAKEHNYSRSEVFSIAVRDFLEKVKSRQLLERLNEAHKDIETHEDAVLRKKSIRHYATRILKEPY